VGLPDRSQLAQPDGTCGIEEGVHGLFPFASPEVFSVSYVVLARRYRPATFDDFVGQDAVATTLKHAVESDRVAHAYLFAGDRGVGKTSMARVLAKALNCEKGPTGTPCNECEICRRISAGDDIDVVEIDGASHRGVDEMTDILERVTYRPARARFKVYIIDEIHMLSDHAFNALLKTLEEPPAHVKFIFATTEPNEVLPTIRSRCQRFDFRRLSAEEIAHQLKTICEHENVQIDDQSLALIARNARGAMRDGLTILDQLMSISPDKITVEDVHLLLGLPPEEEVLDLVDFIQNKDCAGALKLLHEMFRKGTDVLDMINLLTGHLRDLLILATAESDSEAAKLAGQDIERKRKQSQAVSPDTILYMIQVMLDARRKVREGLQAQIVLEMAVIKLARMEDLLPLSRIAERLDEAIRSPGTMPAPSGQTPPRRLSPQPQPPAPRSAAPTSSSAAPTSPPSRTPQPRAPSPNQASEPAAPDPVQAPIADTIEECWPHVVENVARAKPFVAQFLKGATARFPDASTVVLSLPEVQRKALDTLENKRLIQQKAAELLAGQTALRIVLEASNETKQPKRATPSPDKHRIDSIRRASHDPTVGKVLDIFQGRIINVEEPK